jgi:hypothetical protein
MTDERLAYLPRALGRCSDEAILAAREAREQVQAKAAATGMLQSGTMLVQVGVCTKTKAGKRQGK